MDYREKNFRDKFLSASQFFNCSIEDIVSIKLRDIVNSDDYYKRFLELLGHNNNFSVQQVKGNFQGKAFSISAYHTNIICVEHESGLEILYIAGSIASLIQLIPFVIQKWNLVRNKNERYIEHAFEKIETRYFDNNGNLIEEHDSQFGEFSNINHGFLPLINTELHRLNFSLKGYENEIAQLKKRVLKLERKIQRLIKEKKK